MVKVEPSALALVAEAIADRGYVVFPRFLSRGAVDVLRDVARARDEAGEFRSAAVGARNSRVERADIRGDRIRWIDPASAGDAERDLLQTLDRLRRAVNERTYAGLFDTEFHYAIYPPGARYRRHVDQFHADDTRLLSVVIYLNDAWRRLDGGELVLFMDDSALQIAPDGGTLVAFLSGRFEHEVLPAVRERHALTGWFRRRGDQPALAGDR